MRRAGWSRERCLCSGYSHLFEAMNISLSGKRVLITGAGRGIGRALALGVVACGGHVIALSRTQAHLDTLKAQCPSVETVACDLTDWEATRAAVETLGPVHCLVNNAGTGYLKPFLEVNEAEIDNTFDVNLKAVINVSQVVARGMVASGEGGAIVNISSIRALNPKENTSVYCASKAALDHLTRVMTLELGPHGIRVNCVNPNHVKTDLTKSLFEDTTWLKDYLETIPLRRITQLDDVVNAVVFLLSEHSSLISGVSLPVDGGEAAC